MVKERSNFLLIYLKFRHNWHTWAPTKFGSTEAKKVLDALENDTKVDFQDNVSDKVQFQKKWWDHVPCLSPHHHVPLL